MENAQKAIMIAVGLFITIILITAVMAITGIGTGLIDQGQEQLGGLSAQLTSQLTAAFDNKTMSGAQVLSNVTKYYDDPNMVVIVDNAGTSVGVTYNTISGVTRPSAGTSRITNSSFVITEQSSRPELSAYTSSAAADKNNKIITTAMYKSYLIEINDEVVGIGFFKN